MATSAIMRELRHHAVEADTGGVEEARGVDRQQGHQGEADDAEAPLLHAAQIGPPGPQRVAGSGQ